MPYIRIINEDEATGQLAADYACLSAAYSKRYRTPRATPQVYRTASLIDAYFHFGALQSQVLLSDGQHLPEGPLPRILVNFAVALYSSCYY